MKKNLSNKMIISKVKYQTKAAIKNIFRSLTEINKLILKTNSIFFEVVIKISKRIHSIYETN